MQAGEVRRCRPRPLLRASGAPACVELKERRSRAGPWWSAWEPWAPDHETSCSVRSTASSVSGVDSRSQASSRWRCAMTADLR